MADVKCANCGSARVNALADAVGCDECGAATGYDGELVHGPTAREPIHAEDGDLVRFDEDEGVQPQEDDRKAAKGRTTSQTAKKKG